MNAWAAGDYAFNSGRTTTAGAVVRPFRNLGENGRLQPIGAYPDGTPLAYRIIDSALSIFQVKFDL
jgi:hypothetical protein